MTQATHAISGARSLPTAGALHSSRRRRFADWIDEDHLVSHAVLVPTGLAALAGLIGLGYALLFLS